MSNSSILLIVTGDPKTSGRPAEAVRIAAGIAASKKVRVNLYLHGAAVLALAEYPDELLDDDHYARYLPIIGESGRPIYVESGCVHLAEIGQAALTYQELSAQELARMAAESSWVARF